MRVITGSLKGRILYEPHGHKTHPMSEKIRGAIFNALGNIEGLSVLDAFAGSGALSIEAISRGAKNAVAVEKDRAAQTVLLRNIDEMNLKSQVKGIKANTAGWSIHNMEKKFDVILLDPPYTDPQLNLIQRLLNRHLKRTAIAVLSFPGHQKPPEFERVKIVHNKNYGDSQLIFYRKL